MVTVRPAPGVTREWLQRQVEDHMGLMAGAPMSDCPLSVAGAAADVSSTGGSSGNEKFVLPPPLLQAVLLIGGDKTGDDRFYDRMIPIAERIWNEYLEETGQNKPRKK